MHQSYFAIFDRELDTTHQDELILKSKVAQDVLISAYLYDMQFSGNGDCQSHWYKTGTYNSAVIKCDKCTETDEKLFLFGSYHYETVHLAAGEEISLNIKTYFDSSEYLPSDYSVVVWASEEAVDIDVITQNVESEHFPNYKMSDSVQLYDLQGKVIDQTKPDTGIDEDGAADDPAED